MQREDARGDVIKTLCKVLPPVCEAKAALQRPWAEQQPQASPPGLPASKAHSPCQALPGVVSKRLGICSIPSGINHMSHMAA